MVDGADHDVAPATAHDTVAHGSDADKGDPMFAFHSELLSCIYIVGERPKVKSREVDLVSPLDII